MYHVHLWVFSWPTTRPVARKSIAKVLNQNVTRWLKCFQRYVTLSQWFSHKTAAFYTEQCISPSLFLQLLSLMRQFKRFKEELWLHLWCHFLHLYACAPVWWGTHEPWTLVVICNKDCWSRNTVSTCLETGVWTDVTNTACLYWGSLWRQTCCSVIDGKLMHLLLKKWHKQE